MSQIRNYVNGSFVDGISTFDDINAVDGSIVGQVHEADRRIADEAVQSARSALNGAWGVRPQFGYAVSCSVASRTA